MIEAIWGFVLAFLSSPDTNGYAQLFVGAIAWIIGFSVIRAICTYPDFQLTSKPRLRGLIAAIGATIIAFQVAFFIGLMRVT